MVASRRCVKIVSLLALRNKSVGHNLFLKQGILAEANTSHDEQRNNESVELIFVIDGIDSTERKSNDEGTRATT